MSAIYKSLDDTLATIRSTHEAEMQACKDRVLAAEIGTSFLREQLEKANEARATSERITTKLLTQFALVAQIFEEARALALELQKPSQEGGAVLPQNTMEHP